MWLYRFITYDSLCNSYIINYQQSLQKSTSKTAQSIMFLFDKYIYKSLLKIWYKCHRYWKRNFQSYYTATLAIQIYKTCPLRRQMITDQIDIGQKYYSHSSKRSGRVFYALPWQLQKTMLFSGVTKQNVDFFSEVNLCNCRQIWKLIFIPVGISLSNK